MQKRILDILREDVKPGELVALIEKSRENEQLCGAVIAVFEGSTDCYKVHSKEYQASLDIRKGKQKLVVLSNDTLILQPSQKILGRVGFHLTQSLEIPKRQILTRVFPIAMHIGEYDIKRAFEQIPELAVYARLIDSYPIIQQTH